MKEIYLYSIGVWFLFAFVATLNGILRNATYKKVVGELYAHQIGTVIFLIIMFGIMYFFFNRLGLDYVNRDLWIVGFCWLCGTVIFEFIFGHFVFGNSWEKLFADYNILKGRVWSLVLLVTLIGPWLVGKK